MRRGRHFGIRAALAAGTVLAMVNAPYILFHSGKLADPDLRDQMVEEVFAVAMLFLKKH